MSKQEKQVLDNFFGSTSYWQYRRNHAEYPSQQPHKQAESNTDDTWIKVLCILVTIGFLVLLAKTTLGNIL